MLGYLAMASCASGCVEAKVLGTHERSERAHSDLETTQSEADDFLAPSEASAA
jgi:hypothetical protein